MASRKSATTSLLLLTFSLTIFHNGALGKKRVCVIGAGRAGLAATRLAAEQSKDFETIAFERNSDVGGIWIYRDNVSSVDEHGLPAQGIIYKNLKSVLGPSYLTYPDYENLTADNPEVGVSHEVFLDYLRNYTEHFQLRKFIKFNTFVKKITPSILNDSGDNNSISSTTWRVETLNLNTNQSDTTFCDALMICTGVNSKNNVPMVPGIENFTGRVLHSRFYRRPEAFVNQTVLIMGGSTCGSSIAEDLSKCAKSIYISSKHDIEAELDLAAGDMRNVRVVGAVKAVNGSEIILHDNSTIAADTFIFCTGYLPDFPFLDQSSGISVQKKIVRPLHDASINLKHPSMAFIGLIQLPFLGHLYYTQVQFFLNVLMGKQQLNRDQ